MPRMMMIGACCLTATAANALETQDVVGTWHLVSAKRVILDTNESMDAYGGSQPNGWLNFGSDGRVMVMISHHGRQKPAIPEKISDEERIKLHKSFFGYAGTYKIDGKTISNNIDTSWNEAWTGTTQIRDVEFKDGKLVYTTRPAPFSGDGKQSVVTLVWERYR